MLLKDISPTKEDFDQYNWQEVIASSKKKVCDEYLSLLMEKIEEAKTSENIKEEQVFSLLYNVCHLMLQSDPTTEPFSRPSYIDFVKDLCSVVIDDFNDEHFNTLEAIVKEVKDPELRARIADILWCKRKGGYQMAQLAVRSYLESAQVLEDPEAWSRCAKRIQRAVELAVSLGKKKPLFSETMDYIESVLDKYQGEDPLFLSATLMEILQKHKIGNPEKYAKLAEKAANRAETITDPINWHLARTYYKIKAEWHAIDKDKENEQLSLIYLAETYIKAAEDTRRLPLTPYSRAAGLLRQAIEANRKIKDTEKRREELHKRMLEFQEKSTKELRSFSLSWDVSEFVQEAIDIVKGKTLDDALFALAFSFDSPSVAELHKQVKESTENYPYSLLVPKLLLNSQGKVTGYRSGMFGDESESEKVLQAEMYQSAADRQDLYAREVVHNAINQINLEHNVRIADLFPIVSNNPFVPPGREIIFARGLHAGLTGDLLTVAHFLIPQIEQLLRYILVQRGFITSGLDRESIQDEYLLHVVLRKYNSQLKDILGEDIVFDLQGLLVERFGFNLRNLMSHGLMDQTEFESPQVLYLWWLTLRLCCAPIYTSRYQSSVNVSE